MEWYYAINNQRLVPVHRANRTRAIIIGWAFGLLGLAAMAWSVRADNREISLSALFLLAGALIWGLNGGRVVYAKKIDKGADLDVRVRKGLSRRTAGVAR